LDVRGEREPDLGFGTDWTQHGDNQRALLDCFAGHIKPDRSLCFFYAKQVPFVEDAGARRILIGVGRVQNISPPQEYEYLTTDLTGKLRAYLWELMVQHSIRLEYQDGFLLPYHAAIQKSAADPDFDPAVITAFTPADRLPEFSYASELVTHDGAIACLLACVEALTKTKGVLPGPWDQCIRWIDARLSELWKARGPCPGLGAALSAFGVELGTFVTRAIAEKVGENADPWPLVGEMFGDPKKHLPAELAQGIGQTLCTKWQRLQDERRALLKLVSRFEVTQDQATLIYVQEVRADSNLEVTDADILNNPYLIYEATRLTTQPVSVWTVDRGVFPDDVIRNEHPLPKPSALDGGTDARRIRALTVSVLEEAARNGNTLAPQDQLVLAIRDLPLQPKCPLDADLLNVAKDNFGGVIQEIEMAKGAPALQLARLATVGDVIRNAIDRRMTGQRLTVNADWRKLLDKELSKQQVQETDELEESARVEKTATLEELAASRFSVLIGPAGTGKTTLLSVLCGQPDVAAGGILLLAPTGKARVRMEQATKELNLTGYTIAQLLRPHRYDARTGRYRLSAEPGAAGARTVIVDEASMLTEEMLAALIDGLRGVHRLILISDPRQLPPIGAGRPFVDIVQRLAPEGISERFPRVGPGYAELTIRRRQAGGDREDLQLAEWFGGTVMAPGEDAVFDKVVHAGKSAHVQFIRWDSAAELRARLIEILVQELKLKGPDDIPGFDEKLGGLHGGTFASSTSAQPSKPRNGRSSRRFVHPCTAFPI
jgi:hypothetical protein